MAMNILRLMGQRGLLGPDAPVRHSTTRRRIETVLQELIYRAGRLILGLGANDRAGKAFAPLHASLSPTPRARSAARPKLGTSRIQKITLSQRRGVGDTRCAQACERIGVVMSTGTSARKPPGGVIDVRIDILAVKLRLEVGRTGRWSRIQGFVWNATISFRRSLGKRMSRQMLELGHAKVGDGDEVGRGAEAPCGALGLLKQTIHGLDEGVGSVVDYFPHDGLGARGDRLGQLLE